MKILIILATIVAVNYVAAHCDDDPSCPEFKKMVGSKPLTTNLDKAEVRKALPEILVVVIPRVKAPVSPEATLPSPPLSRPIGQAPESNKSATNAPPPLPASEIVRQVVNSSRELYSARGTLKEIEKQPTLNSQVVLGHAGLRISADLSALKKAEQLSQQAAKTPEIDKARHITEILNDGAPVQP